MIAHSGLIPHATWEEVETAFIHYQQRRQRSGATRAAAKARFAEFLGRRTQAAPEKIPLRPPIRFVGVWDTVGTLGIPQAGNLARVIEWLNPRWSYRFYDVGLSSLVQTARHALAADEQRQPFTATLWQLPEQEQGRDVVQAWFPGCHSDVGGGFLECGLADLALEWMLTEAQRCGAVFNDSMLQQARAGDFMGPMHDPLSVVYNLMGARPRALPPLLSTDQTVSLLPHGQCAHPRTLARVQAPPLSDAPYRPSHLPQANTRYQFEVYARDYWNAPGIYVEAGKTYRLTATGSWQDSQITHGPAGGHGGWRALYLSLFTWVRRAPHANWLTLMASIASGQASNTSNDMNRFPTYVIAAGGVIRPEVSGYLYLWANDATGFYGNNRGAVQVTLELETSPEAEDPSASSPPVLLLPPLPGCEPGFWTLAVRWGISTFTLAYALYAILAYCFGDVLALEVGRVMTWLVNQIGLPEAVLNVVLPALLGHPLLCFFLLLGVGLFGYSYWGCRADTRVKFVPVTVEAA
jgi:hypothetical protein